MTKSLFARSLAALCFGLNLFVISVQAQTISATLDDNVPTGNRKNRGEVITNTVTITNTSGASATSVTLTVPTPANATDVAGTVHASPIAFDDSYTAIGNTKLYVGVGVPVGEPAKFQSGPLLVANDTIATDAISLVGFTSPTSQGGSVTVNSDGSFVYTPPAGFTGTDTFTYAPANSTDATLAGSGLVSISVGNRVWYVNNSGANGNGTSASPFNSLANAQSASATNDFVYLFTGSGNYAAGITLKNNQTFVGQGVALVVSGTTLLAAGSRPTIAQASGAAITLASSNTVFGLNVSSSVSGGGIVGGNIGSLFITNMIVSCTSGRAISFTNGTVDVTFDSLSCTSSPDNGIYLNGINGTFTANGGTLQNCAGADVFISGGAANITYPGGITDNAGQCVNISGRTGGTITFSGSITNTSQGIVMQNNTGGTTTFSGTIKRLSTGANTAVNLTSNNGHTINFSNGGLTITNTATGFSATGGATAINVTGSGNRINSGTGTALNVVNSTIGASGLTFERIDSSGGSSTGIILDNPGTAGGLTITGDGSNTSKGGNGSGGTIASKTGADGSSTTGCGIYLNNTTNIILRRMQINSVQNTAVYGQLVNGFTFQYCTINGVNGDASGLQDGCLAMGKSNPSGVNGLSGTALIDNCKISGAVEHNMEFYNQSGTFNLTISNCDVKSNSVALGSDGLQIEMQGTANATISVQNCAFDDNKSQAVQAAATDNSILAMTVNGCTVARTSQGNEGLIFSCGSNGRMTLLCTTNTITGVGGASIFVGQTPGNASATSFLTATIRSNSVVHPADAANSAVLALLTSTIGQVAPATLVIDNNRVVENSTNGISRGIFVDTPDTSTTPSFCATVVSNYVSVGDNIAGLQGIALQSRRNTGTFDVRNNRTDYPNGTPAGVSGLRVRQASPGTANLEQGSFSGTAAAVLAANNPLSTTEVIGTVTVVANSTCP